MIRDILDTMFTNEQKLHARAQHVGAKIEQYLQDINAAGDLGEDATSRKLKTAFDFKTDEGYYRDVEITVTVVEKPQKTLGGIKWGKKKEKVDDGQTSFDVERNGGE